MTSLKVLTVVGTRPELIRLSRLIPKLDEQTDHVLVHTGQNFDRQLNQVFFDDLNLRTPDHYLNVDTSSVGKSIGEVIEKFETVLLDERPRAVMVLGDTNSAFAAVIAERHGIPVYHMEAGNRSFDRNVPEELNRKLVDHVSSFNLPYTEYAKHNLLAEGIHPRTIFKTGSPIGEVFAHYRQSIERSAILERLDLEADSYFLASIHRQENVDSIERLQQVIESLEAVASAWKLPVLVSTHPRTRSRLDSLGQHVSPLLKFHEPFGYLDYNKLQLNARCVISDSGSISEEAAIMHFRAVSFRDSIERPESLDSASMVLAGTKRKSLLRSVEYVLSRADSSSDLPNGYEVVNFSERVMNVLFSTIEQHEFWSGLRRHPFDSLID